MEAALARPEAQLAAAGLTAVVWATLLITLYSGVTYVRAAITMLRPSP